MWWTAVQRGRATEKADKLVLMDPISMLCNRMKVALYMVSWYVFHVRQLAG